MSSNLSHKAYMIGAGIGNLSAAVYLIRDGEWNGEDITIMGLDMHGANDGESAATFSTSTAIANSVTTRVSSIVAVACSTRRPMRTSGTC
ncbi:oleate hydratase [Rhodococcus sp. EPR-134]|uniref:oleate hydratase n=1 Tax=Rhodococcus sp. EPR-134 TaxID=1813675 RepID=UPI000A4568E9